jgi:hypothetical protein
VTRAVQRTQHDRFSLLDRSTEGDRPMTVQEKQTYAHTDIRAPVRCPAYFFVLSPSGHACTVRGFEARKNPSTASSKDLMQI